MNRSAASRVHPAAAGFLLACLILAGCGSAPDNAVITRNFLYVADYADNTVAPYSVSSSGALVPVPGGSATTGGGPVFLAADPSGRFLFSADLLGNTVSTFTVRDDGGLQRNTPPAETGVGPRSLAVAVPVSGTVFVYAANSVANSLSAFEVANSVTGQLAPLAPPSYPTGANPRSVASARPPAGGTYLYSVNGTDRNVSAFSVAGNGTLTGVPGSPFTGRAPFVSPVSLATDPSGGFLYVVDGGASTVTAFSIDPATGALQELPFSPWVTGAAATPLAVAVDNGGKGLWVAQSGALCRFPIVSSGTSTGSLASPPTLGTDNTASRFGSVAVDVTGKFAYATDDPFATPAGNRIHGFALQDNGALVPAPGMPFPSGSAPSAVAVIRK